MLRCTACGEVNDTSFSFCSRCGKSLAEEKRALNRYGAADPEFPDPKMESEQIPEDPYLIYYSIFGTPRHMTKRFFFTFSFLLALIYGVVIFSQYAQGKIDAVLAILIFLAVLAIQRGGVWLLGRFNAGWL